MDIFSNLQVVGECLLDKKRINVFKNAIKRVVKPGDIVVDVGTGTGILAMFAARAGATHVYAVEIAEDVAKFAKQNIDSNDYGSKIEVINIDAKDLYLPNPVDVVSAELLDTCLVAEQQAQALNHLRRNNISNENTKMIPYQLDCAVDAIEYDFNFYGFDMPFVIQARNFGVKTHVTKQLSGVVTFKKVDFCSIIDTNVDETFDIKISQAGRLNALRLKSKTYLSKSVQVWGTSDMNMPVVVPVNEILVKKGDSITVKIKYQMGEGFGNFTAEIS